VINAVRAARDFGFAEETDQIVVTAGIPFNVPGHHQHPARGALRRAADLPRRGRVITPFRRTWSVLFGLTTRRPGGYRSARTRYSARSV
jgi:hypothetical protein